MTVEPGAPPEKGSWPSCCRTPKLIERLTSNRYNPRVGTRLFQRFGVGPEARILADDTNPEALPASREESGDAKPPAGSAPPAEATPPPEPMSEAAPGGSAATPPAGPDQADRQAETNVVTPQRASDGKASAEQGNGPADNGKRLPTRTRGVPRNSSGLPLSSGTAPWG